MSDYGTPPPPPPGGGSYGAPPPPDGGFQPAGQVGNLAGWPLRAGGYIIDMLLLIPGYIVYYIGAPKGIDNTTGQTRGGNLAIMLIGVLIIIGIQVWNRWMKGGKGQTVGRKVVGITLVGEQTQQPIGTGLAFARDLAHIIDAIPCYIGFLFPLWDSKRQTLADKILKTVVVTAPK